MSLSNASLPELILRPREDKRIRQGHHWIYSNEIDTKRCSLKQFSSGELVQLLSDQGKHLGIASVNPQSLICGRLLSRNAKQVINQQFFEAQIKASLRLREMCFSQPYYRLIYGDSDGLSGLVVDRFNDVLVVQINTAGMEVLKDVIIQALDAVLKPTVVYVKNDSSMRALEGLAVYAEEAIGTAPDLVPLIENDTAFMAPIKDGQKTGWFYDHRPGRAKVQALASGKRVLDLFSYLGAWGLSAAKAGAEEVVCVDSSQFALDLLHDNAASQGLADRVSSLQGDAFAALEHLIHDNERFDIVIVDPPAFIKRKKDATKGRLAYQKINTQALRLLSDNGVLVSASCSMHLARHELIDCTRGAARQIERHLRIFDHCGQGADHPIHPAIAETEYLKTIFSQVSFP